MVKDLVGREVCVGDYVNIVNKDKLTRWGKLRAIYKNKYGKNLFSVRVGSKRALVRRVFLD